MVYREGGGRNRMKCRLENVGENPPPEKKKKKKKIIIIIIKVVCFPGHTDLDTGIPTNFMLFSSHNYL